MFIYICNDLRKVNGQYSEFFRLLQYFVCSNMSEDQEVLAQHIMPACHAKAELYKISADSRVELTVRIQSLGCEEHPPPA